MIQKPGIIVLYHIFYEDTFEKVCHELEPLIDFGAIFFFNICEETPDKRHIGNVLRSKFPNCHIIHTTNRGKDIGGKLTLIRLFLELQMESDVLLFLHDKKSLQALKNRTWKKDLLKIVSAGNIQKSLSIFREQKSCGIIATNEYIINEPFENNSFKGINGQILSNLVLEFGLQPQSFAFVAGTMFWARTEPVKKFFEKHDPLEIRKKLEDGNILDNFSGTMTHSWERALSWIITNQGYSIKGI